MRYTVLDIGPRLCWEGLFYDPTRAFGQNKDIVQVPA